MEAGEDTLFSHSCYGLYDMEPVIKENLDNKPFHLNPHSVKIMSTD